MTPEERERIEALAREYALDRAQFCRCASAGICHGCERITVKVAREDYFAGAVAMAEIRPALKFRVRIRLDDDWLSHTVHDSYAAACDERDYATRETNGYELNELMIVVWDKPRRV